MTFLCFGVVSQLLFAVIFLVIMICDGFDDQKPCSKETYIFKDRFAGNFADGLDNYKSNQRCKWMIVNPNFVERPFISLQFTEKTLECSFDYVVVLSSDNEETRLLATLSGNSEASGLPSFYSRAQYLLIYLFTDMNYELPGFSAVFNIYGCPNNCTGNGNCVRNKCHCLHAWSGEDCSKPLCPDSCFGRGRCLLASTKQCACDNDFIGVGCQMPWEGPGLFDWVAVDSPLNMKTNSAFTAHLVGHAGAYVEPYLWIFGGYDLNKVYEHLLRYNFTENKWDSIAADFHPSARFFHSISHLHYDSHDYLLLFGGEKTSGALSNELWIFNITSLSWKLITNNSISIATAQHSACIVNDTNGVFLYVFGGKIVENAETKLSSALQRFRWTSRAWEQIQANNAGVSETVLPRAGHSMIYDSVSHSLIVFGGFALPESGSGVQRSHTLLKFDLNRFFWIELANPSPSKTSSSPKSMAFHSANVVGDRMVIFGGSTHAHSTDESCHDNFMYFYHLRCQTWTQKVVSTDFPYLGRFGHVAAKAHQNVLLIHGGYNGTVLNDIMAYKVPLYDARQNTYSDCDFFRNDNAGCANVNTCTSCSSYSFNLYDDWRKSSCHWCVNKASCFSSIKSDKCYDYQHNSNQDWWPSGSNQLINSTSRCLYDNVSPGFLAAFYINDEALSNPNKIVFLHDKFSVVPDEVPKAPGNHVLKIEGFLHFPTEFSSVDVFLDTKDGVGQLFLSNNDDKSLASLRLENAGNLTLNDIHPSLTLRRNTLDGSRLYYRVMMTYAQDHDNHWRGYLTLSWKMNRSRVETAIPSEFLEPFRSPNPVQKCVTYHTCSNCLLDFSCAWCSGIKRCMSRNTILQSDASLCANFNHATEPLEGRLYFGVVLDPSSCPICYSRQTCSDCVTDDWCSWNSTAGCQNRNFYGEGNEITSASICPVPCSIRNTCAECLDGSQCAWCSRSKTCFNYYYYHLENTFGQCVLWTRDVSDCPNCKAANTCKECVGNLFCGWCTSNSSPFQGSCTLGNLVGPYNASECSSADHLSTNIYEWIYGHCHVNECEIEWPVGSQFHDCSANATCTDTISSYKCECQRGFVGDGFDCEPTCYKDCVHGICGAPPLFQCDCDIGWTGNSTSTETDCDADCGCNFHSFCDSGIGICDNCTHHTTGADCGKCLPKHFGNAASKDGCEPCQCNGHGDSERGVCDVSNGSCFCTNDTAGPNCEKCLHGFYGDPRNGGKCFRICDGRYQLQNKSGDAFGTWSLQPRLFINNILCIYLVSSSAENDLILLKIDKNINISCLLTRLNVYDAIPSAENTSNLLAAICGKSFQQDAVMHSATGVLYLSYESDVDGYSGFNATVEVLTCKPCSWKQSLKLCSSCDDEERCLKEMCRCNAEYTLSSCAGSKKVSVGALMWQKEMMGLTMENSSLLTVPSQSSPGPLFGHTMVAWGRKLWVFGGSSYKSISDNLWSYDLLTKSWTLVTLPGNSTPEARWLHAAVVHGDKMLVYGGINQNQTTLSDLWKFQFRTKTWSKITSRKNLPDLAGHTLTLCSNSTLVLLGGYSATNWLPGIPIWKFNLTSDQWSRPTRARNSKRRRCCVLGHSTTYDSHAQLLYVYGGFNALDVFQLYTYDINSNQWKAVYHAFPSKLPMFHLPFRSLQSSAPYHEGNTRGFLVFGGKSLNGDVFNDIWLYRYDCKLWMRLDRKKETNYTTEIRYKFGYLSAAAVMSSDNNSYYYVYGGNQNGIILESLESFQIDSLCKAATTHCECATMLSGCKLDNSSSESEDFCIDGNNVNDTHAESSVTAEMITSPQCSECNTTIDSMPEMPLSNRLERSSDVCNIVLDSYPNVCNRDSSCDYCSSIFTSLGINSIGGKQIISNCTYAAPLGALHYKYRSSFPFLFFGRCGIDTIINYKLIASHSRFGDDRCCFPCDSHILQATDDNISPRFRRTDLQSCLPSALMSKLGSIRNLCRGVDGKSDSSCLSRTCQSIAYCHQCLRAPSCGWLSFERDDGNGSCVEGSLEGPASSNPRASEIQNVQWNFLTCPPENECENDHHQCNTSKDLQHTVCRDLFDGYECVCDDKYQLSSDNKTCEPVCNPSCNDGFCKAPDVCECHFGYIGSRCEHRCNCNGHSGCSISDDNIETCTNCSNNTTGDRCQHCKENFVGNPVNNGRCEPCLYVCNNRSNDCERNPASHFVGGNTAIYGPTNRFSAMCKSCFGNSEGRYCEICLEGFFKLDGECHACSCNGHDEVCDRRTGKCACKNNTETLPEQDCLHDPQFSKDRLGCLSLQCNHCKTFYMGNPVGGGQCYYKINGELNSDCIGIHGSAHMDCASPLPPGKTSFFYLRPQYSNVDIRLIIDISSSIVDVYITNDPNFFQVKTDPATWQHEVTWKNKVNIPVNEPLQSSTKTKRETVWYSTVTNLTKSRRKRSQTIEVRSQNFSGPYQLLSVKRNEALWVKGVNSRLIILCSPYHHQLNTTRFYIILQSQQPTFRASMTSSTDDVTSGAVGRIIFRQDLTNINFFVFSTVIFSCFCILLFVFVILWKIKNTVNTQQAIIAHHMQLQHMASRPFSDVYISFTYDATLAIQMKKKKITHLLTNREKSSFDSSCVHEHRIPLLHTPGDFLTVVTPEDESSRITPDLHPADMLIPEVSSRKILVVPRSSHQFSLSDSPRSPLSRSSSTPSLSQTPSCSYAHSSSHSAPAVCSSKCKKISFQPETQTQLFDVAPLVLERTSNFQAAIATFMLQLPGVGGQSCSMCLGSALVSTRNMNFALNHNDKRISKRKKYSTTKFL